MSSYDRYTHINALPPASSDELQDRFVSVPLFSTAQISNETSSPGCVNSRVIGQAK